jgi:TRAP-type mannitol/chloroaromatic compound transport system substrate-binding protein
MRRRAFLGAGLGAASVAVAAPAIAQSMPEVKWRLASSFPKSLDTLFGGAERIGRAVSDATDGKFQIRPFASGEIVPGLQVLDAVQAGTVECGQTATYYYVGKDPTFAFGTALPFGLNTRQQNAWIHHGGGEALLNEFYKDYNVIGLSAGHTGAQMGGWFRKEIKTAEDLKGLKFRIGGYAGQVVAKLGCVPQQIAAGDIYPALEKGTIDAAEWVGPYDDEKLGFVKVARNYYYPGWWEGCAMGTVFVNLAEWQKLPKNYRTILRTACHEEVMFQSAKYDAENPAALRRLAASGASLRPFSREIMEACYNAAQQLYNETIETNAKFKKVYDSWKPFRDEELIWFSLAEGSFDTFMQGRARAAQSAPRPAAKKG